MFAGDESAFVVDGIAVAVVAGFAESGGFASGGIVLEHPIVGDVGEDYEATGVVASWNVGRAFCPFCTGVVLSDLDIIASDEVAEAGVDDYCTGSQIIVRSETVTVLPGFVGCLRHVISWDDCCCGVGHH